MELRPELEESVGLRLREGPEFHQTLVDRTRLGKPDSPFRASTFSDNQSSALQASEEVREVRTGRRHRSSERRWRCGTVQVQLHQDRPRNRLSQESDEHAHGVGDGGSIPFRSFRVGAQVPPQQAQRHEPPSPEPMEVVVEGPDGQIHSSPDLSNVNARIARNERQQCVSEATHPFVRNHSLPCVTGPA